MDSTQDLGARILDLRDERGWSQVELAKRAGISHTTVNALENGHGKPRMATLRRVARAFGLPVEDITPKPEAPSSPVDEYAAAMGRIRIMLDDDPERAAAYLAEVAEYSYRFAKSYVAALPSGVEKDGENAKLLEVHEEQARIMFELVASGVAAYRFGGSRQETSARPVSEPGADSERAAG